MSKASKPFELSPEEMASLVAEVDAEVEALFKAEADALSKADKDGPPSEDKDSSDSDAGASSAPADSGPPPAASASPDASASPSPSAPPGPDPSASASASPDASASASPGDFSALVAEFSKMPPDQLEIYSLAIKSAQMQLSGGSPDASTGAAPPGASPSPSAAPGPSPSAPPGPPAMKAEVSAGEKVSPSPGNGGKSAPAAKSEPDPQVAELRKALDEQKQMTEGLTKVVEMIAGAPVRKAVTSVAFLGKGEEPAPTDKKVPQTRPEMIAKLNELARTPDKLKKSDRELIHSFCVNKVGVKEIEHLLTM